MIAIPYISLVIILFLRHYISNIGALYKKTETIFVYFIFFLFFGFRGFIFTDCFGYYTFFSICPDIITIFKTNYLTQSWFEPGFTCYCGIIKLFTSNWIIFQIIDTAIDLILLHKSLEYYNSERSLNIVILLAMSGLILFIDLFRNVKAVLLFFYSLRFIHKKQIIKYFIICFIAFLFHKSAIIYLLCYPILKNDISRRKYLYIGIGSVILGFLLKPILVSAGSFVINYLPDRFQQTVLNYTLSDNSLSKTRVISLGVLEKLITFFLIFFNYSKIIKDRKCTIFIHIFLLYFVFYFLFFGFSEVSNRLSIIFAFGYWCLIPLIVRKQSKKNQLIYVICIFFYCLLKMSLYSQPVQKYENWIFGASSYIERKSYNLTSKI